jgi:hypothetical protein
MPRHARRIRIAVGVGRQGFWVGPGFESLPSIVSPPSKRLTRLISPGPFSSSAPHLPFHQLLLTQHHLAVVFLAHEHIKIHRSASNTCAKIAKSLADIRTTGPHFTPPVARISLNNQRDPNRQPPTLASSWLSRREFSRRQQQLSLLRCCAVIRFLAIALTTALFLVETLHKSYLSPSRFPCFI